MHVVALPSLLDHCIALWEVEVDVVLPMPESFEVEVEVNLPMPGVVVNLPMPQWFPQDLPQDLQDMVPTMVGIWDKGSSRRGVRKWRRGQNTSCKV